MSADFCELIQDFFVQPGRKKDVVRVFTQIVEGQHRNALYLRRLRL